MTPIVTPTKTLLVVPQSSRVFTVLPGPHVVRVHEALEERVIHSPFRFFLTVDGKARPHAGNRAVYWRGMTRAEAARAARELYADLLDAERILEAAKASTLPGHDLLLQIAQKRRDVLLDGFSCAVEVGSP